MTLPSDSQQANDGAKIDSSIHPEYEMLGHFELRDAKHILKRLEEQHLSFEVEECSQHGIYDVWPWRHRWLSIYIRPEDKKKAEAISDENSVRSRAAAGSRYVVIGGVICALLLLQMRSGIRTIPYRSGQPVPLEFLAGIAGIVLLMGLLQLLVALILKLRRRQ